MPISTTQILLGFVLVAIGASFGAFCFGFADSHGLDAAILSPEDESVHPPGPIILRIRASDGDDPPHWALSYRAVAGSGEWRQIEEGNSAVAPRDVDRGGLEVLELAEPGEYEFRLVVENEERTEQLVDTVRFTIAP